MRVITMDDGRVETIIGTLQEIAEDTSVPRNVKLKLAEIITVLKNQKEELLIRKDKALSGLDEIAEDANLQAYARTQIWNVVSALEML